MVARFSGGGDSRDDVGVASTSLAGGGAIDDGRRGAGLGPIGTAAASSVPKAAAGEVTVSA